jgi:hypothetical protein
MDSCEDVTMPQQLACGRSGAEQTSGWMMAVKIEQRENIKNH